MSYKELDTFANNFFKKNIYINHRNNIEKEKIYLNVRTQIGILRSRGIIIKTNKKTKQLFLKTNYYNLINGYKEPFLNKSNKKFDVYLKNTTIEEIYSLYIFDKELRILTLNFILQIEKEVKSIISHCFSKKYGHKNYLKIENFNNYGMKMHYRVCELLSNLYKKIQNNIDKEPSIKHYISNKNYLPLWVFVNSISMGDISKFYANMLQKDRNEVVKNIKWGIKEEQLDSCLFLLSSIRNRCAHDERLFSYLSHVELRNNKYSNYFKINNKNNFFAVVIALKMLLSNKDYIDFHKKLNILFAELSYNLKVISIKDIKKIMGFPNNWEKLKNM